MNPSGGNNDPVFSHDYVCVAGALKSACIGSHLLDEQPPGSIGEGIAEASSACVALLAEVDDGIDDVPWHAALLAAQRRVFAEFRARDGARGRAAAIERVHWLPPSNTAFDAARWA